MHVPATSPSPCSENRLSLERSHSLSLSICSFSFPFSESESKLPESTAAATIAAIMLILNHARTDGWRPVVNAQTHAHLAQCLDARENISTGWFATFLWFCEAVKPRQPLFFGQLMYASEGDSSELSPEMGRVGFRSSTIIA